MRIEITPHVVYDVGFFIAWYCATYYNSEMAAKFDSYNHVTIGKNMFCGSSIWNDACDVAKKVIGVDFPVSIHKGDNEDPILQRFFEDYPELNEITFVFND